MSKLPGSSTGGPSKSMDQLSSQDENLSAPSGSEPIKRNLTIRGDSEHLSKVGESSEPKPKAEGLFEPTTVPAERLSQPSLESFESEFRASIIHFHDLLLDRPYYFLRGTPTITQLLNETGPSKYMRDLPVLNYGTRTTFKDDRPRPDLRWIHLPANNMSWVEKLVRLIYQESANPGDTKIKPPEAEEAEPKDVEHVPVSEADLLLRPQFWNKRQYAGPNGQASVQGRFMRPFYSRISTSWSSLDADIFSEQHHKSNLVVYIPYVHWDDRENYVLRNKCLDWMLKKGAVMRLSSEPQTNRLEIDYSRQKRIKSENFKERNAEEGQAIWTRENIKWNLVETLPKHAKLLLAYVHESLPLHIRRTLDQSFYYTLPNKDVRKRDLDQVLYRHTKVDEDKARLLMIDQLWLWLIDKPGNTKTIITAFPQRWDPEVTPSFTPDNTQEQLQTDPTNIYERIFSALCDVDSKIGSDSDLICLIIDKCSGLFHPRPYEADHKLDFLDVFAVAIGSLADDSTKLANSFWNHSNRLDALMSRRDELLRASVKERFFKRYANPDTKANVPNIAAAGTSNVEIPNTDVANVGLPDPEALDTSQSRARDASPNEDSGKASVGKKISEKISSFPRKVRQKIADVNMKIHPQRNSDKKPPRIFSSEDIEKWFADKTVQDFSSEDRLAGLANVLRKASIPEIEYHIETEMNALVTIVDEAECLKEIKDILDELNSISYNFQLQIKVVRSMMEDFDLIHHERKKEHEQKRKENLKRIKELQDLQRKMPRVKKGGKGKGKIPLISESHDSPVSGKHDSSNTTDGGNIEEELESLKDQLVDEGVETAKKDAQKYKQTYDLLVGREQDVGILRTEATRVYKSLCDLLDLKQKQASVSEAFSARQEAKESARQGQTVLLFTIITIIFLPLSFIAAIYSMNADEINGMGGRRLSDVFKIMFPTTVGVLLFSLFFAYNSYVSWFIVGIFTFRRKRKARAKHASKEPIAAKQEISEAMKGKTQSRLAGRTRELIHSIKFNQSVKKAASRSAGAGEV